MSILKKPSTRATLRHYGHDMSFRRSFTATTGMLLPVMWDYLNPNESIRVNESIFFRTQPLKTAADVCLSAKIRILKQITTEFIQAWHA